MINTSLKLRRSFIPMLFDTSEWKISDITIDRQKSSQHEQKAVLISDRAFFLQASCFFLWKKKLSAGMPPIKYNGIVYSAR
jgi:hypothetical protein